ncbi:MAG: hypothetical protein J6C23_04570 [Clostridia bacterium]|nr:hypothetical protein [Clostridia bacterium]
MYCKYCGNDIGDAVFCPNCNKQSGYDVLLSDATHYDQVKKVDDVPNIFLIILAFFIPLFGFIYYFTQISKYKVKSRAYGISALVSVGVNVVVLVLMLLMII